MSECSRLSLHCENCVKCDVKYAKLLRCHDVYILLGCYYIEEKYALYMYGHMLY